MNCGTKQTAKGATNAKTQANSKSPRPESNGRRPGPRFGQKSWKQFLKWYCKVQNVIIKPWVVGALVPVAFAFAWPWLVLSLVVEMAEFATGAKVATYGC